MRSLALLMMAVAISACATTSTASAPARAPFSSESITHDEMAGSRYRDVLSAIRALRPFYLNARGFGGNTVATYIDGVRINGGLDILATLSIDQVAEIRHLSGIDATTRYGIGHPAGAILVTTRRGASQPR